MNHVLNAVTSLKQGEVILVPTDTNYALAADPWNEAACRKIFELKQRDLQKPLTIFIANPQEIWKYVDISKVQQIGALEKLIAFMPGPINIVVPKTSLAPSNQFIKSESVALVCNKQPVLREVIELFGRPLGLSSANISGVNYETLIDADLAYSTFGDRVGYILPHSDKLTTTVSSTIVSFLGDTIEILRKGDIDIQDILI
ncbi:TPA: L-threonylcarbamoyladenylate synthase [Providencia stuartii]|uniref:L-threonylcarbamoyladenylate synthase n=1 Tax=Providencia stuartii TaxID=588 RepID=UPI00113FE326|nr:MULTISPECIES: L-threonylcarbamoyladenylate synthase [Providencia]MBN5561336.1 L-threonylcarbamoyladenylate synthase [Providencia stuartii]MBN5601094.1 L-threonylcarbamoyladenylate synthase [Providencia stuartii]MBN5605215.1 L-threonylcarbamoyladenylate synthase [Providencia stuartii]MCL8326002.1 L-threonylcarbamoyladenylate synthase [Providencia thailandensis]MDF4173392.1 L-threonylcarbamoyladenylate synthase [Providencia thailandensis]